MYAFAREDLDRWESELGRVLPDGSFGENLTVSGVDPNEALIGEQWRIGDGTGLAGDLAPPPLQDLCRPYGGAGVGQALHVRTAGPAPT